MKVRIERTTKKQKDEALSYAMNWLKGTAMPKVTRNVEAIILWQLHEQFGFGKKRLLKFLDNTMPMLTHMLDYYDYQTDEDAIWICEHKLKTVLGIDLNEINSPFEAKPVVR